MVFRPSTVMLVRWPGDPWRLGARACNSRISLPTRRFRETSRCRLRERVDLTVQCGVFDCRLVSLRCLTEPVYTGLQGQCQLAGPVGWRTVARIQCLVKAGRRGPAGCCEIVTSRGEPFRRVRPSKRHDTEPWLQGRCCSGGLPARNIRLHGWRGATGCASGRCSTVRSSAADVISWLRRGTRRPARGGRSQRRPLRPSGLGFAGERHCFPGGGRRGTTGRGRTGRGAGVFRYERLCGRRG